MNVLAAERPQRLLYVSTVPNSLWGFLRPFAAHFRSLGWKVDGAACAATACERTRAAFDQVFDVAWSRNPFDPRNLLQAARTIRGIVEAGGYDIVHVHTPVAAFVTRYGLRPRTGHAPAVVYTAHGFHFHPLGRPWKNAIFRGLERMAGRWTDHLVVINHTDEEAAIRYGIVPRERVHYIPGIGVDTERYSRAQVNDAEVRRVRAELGAGPHDPVLLMLAEFNPGKRHADAVHAVAAAGVPNLHLALAGFGPTEGAVRALAANLGLASRVHLLGMRHDVLPLLAASRALMLVSEREGLSRSVMEAMSLEVPVIGSDIRGIRDLVEREAGLLVRPGDVEGLARAIRFVLDNPDKAARMGRRGRERVMNFDLRRVIEKHEELYRAVRRETCSAVLR